ncbi:MAG: DUF2799 domain-containing protein [Gammaproteobacteria bacterium]|nr:DUF2799 domain-containing protein [Gammaproteobacteria bacterium]MDH3413365.1 DUF2799 domain-containing protein [Gammaproteobacteria bacterium]
MNLRNLTLILAGALVLQGCGGGMSKDECLVADWYAVGYEDGSRGAPAGTIGNHRKACAEHGVAPNMQAYQQGRNEGLALFCQPSKGFNLGARGSSYQGVCPRQLEPEFLSAYNSGRRLYELESSVNYTNRQIHAKKQYLKKLKHSMIDTAAALVSDQTLPEDRLHMLAESHEMAKSYGEVEAEIEMLEHDRAIQEDELARYRAQLASGY